VVIYYHYLLLLLLVLLLLPLLLLWLSLLWPLSLWLLMVVVVLIIVLSILDQHANPNDVWKLDFLCSTIKQVGPSCCPNMWKWCMTIGNNGSVWNYAIPML
jgi:hypothetical protein